MVFTYEEALNWMLNRTKFGIVPGLQRMEEMLTRLNNPQEKVKVVHVAGTNGKGSTISYLQSILLDAGYTVGTFTSPYIIDYREQIMFCGEMIQEEVFIQLVNHFIPIVEEVEKLPCGAPTEFEIITAMAFYYFGEIRENDLFLVEVGLGGLEDCTNVITPLISIITSIGHDHHQILGDTIEAITLHKAGIIKAGVPTITAELKEEALNIIRNMAIKNGAELYEFGKHISVQHINSDNGEKFTYYGINSSIENVEISMLGKHQIRNASCALMAIEILSKKYNMKFSTKDIKEGLKRAHKPGRLEILISEPMVLIDGAHNVEGIKSLVETIKTHFEREEIKILFSALKDKEVEEMVAALREIAKDITITTFQFPRAMSEKELVECAVKLNLTYENDYRTAIDYNLKKIQKNGTLLITGSLYFISDVRKYLLSNNV